MCPIQANDLLVKTRMPGKSYRGGQVLLSEEEQRIRESLYSDVKALAHDIGERNLWHYAALQQSVAYIRGRLERCGYEVGRQPFDVEGRQVENIEAEIAGSGGGI